MLFQILAKIREPNRYGQLRSYTMRFVLLSAVASMMYHPLFYGLILPVVLLLVFDYCFLTVFVHYLKKFIFDLKIYVQRTNSQFIFQGKKIENQSDDDVWYKGFVLLLPNVDETEDTQKLNQNLVDLKNFLWILQLYKQGEMKYFSYILAIVLINVLFLLLLYRVYFMGVCNDLLAHKGKTGFLMFTTLIVWLVYVHARLKSLLGLDYFRYVFSDYQKKLEFRPYMKHLTIYRVETKTNRLEPYRIETMLKDISSLKNTIIKNLDYFIGFVSTVLFIGILTFLSQLGD